MSQDRDGHTSSAEQWPDSLGRRRVLGGITALGVGLASGMANATAFVGGAARLAGDSPLDRALRARVQNIVVIYAENRSVANLFGHFPGVQSVPVAVSALFKQLDRDGKTVLPRLPPIWGGLVPVAQEVDGKQYQILEGDLPGLPNAPFVISDADGKPLPNHVITRDLWHRFYQNQMQINGGRNDQFVAWGDCGALVMGCYHNSAKTLRLWQLAQQYTFCDNFFMAAFGGSWLNHMFLISAQPPFYPNVHNSPAKHLIVVLDRNDPSGTRLALAADSPASALAGPPKFAKDGIFTPDGYAVNTLMPPYQPSRVLAPPGNPAYADPTSPIVLPPQHHPTVGDRLSEKGIDWAWYSGAWQYALDSCGEKNNNAHATLSFQYHHQPFNYFANYAPGTQARHHHLRDAGQGDDASTNHFIAAIDAGRLPAVTFYKPQGNLNMHAGYADIDAGDRHISKVIEHIQHSPQWANTVIIMAFDENGGWWDPVAPPQGDRWGPGSRIPAIVIAPFAKQAYVDHTLYDTNSILRFISRVHGLAPLDGVAARDQACVTRGAVPLGDLTNALDLT
jgi:acid phosphatase